MKGKHRQHWNGRFLLKVRRKGSTYIVVVGISIIVMSISLGALAIAQAKRRANTMQGESDSASVLAQSAIEQALSQISADPDWRNSFAAYQGSQFSPIATMSTGEFSWQLHDVYDNQVNNNRADPFRIKGRSTSGLARRATSVLAIENGLPLDVLCCSAHADGNLQITDTAITGQGPVSTNQQLQLLQAELHGTAEANSIDFPGNIIGAHSTMTVPKKMPSRFLFDVYSQLASQVHFSHISSSGLHDQLITPDYPPTNHATKNPDGVYYVRVPAGQQLLIERVRIEGTLIVLLDGSTSSLRIGQSVVWKPYRKDYPSLIVKTTSDVANEVEIECGGQLNEVASNVNFNPVDATYFNDGDANIDDSYAASLRGVFHVIRDVTSPQSKTIIKTENPIVGCIIAEGNMDIVGHSRFVADRDLLRVPPIGYTKGRAADLIANGSMNTQIAPWFPVGATASGGGTNLRLVAVSHDSTLGVEVANRQNGASGIAQDLTNRIESGLTLNGSFKLKLLEQDEDVLVTLEIIAGSTIQRFSQTKPATTSWSTINFLLTPSWSAQLDSARLIISTTLSDQAFQLDQVSITDPRSTPTSQIHLFNSTWQQDPYPN